MRSSQQGISFEGYVNRLSDDHWGRVARQRGAPRRSNDNEVDPFGEKLNHTRQRGQAEMTFMDVLNALQMICHTANQRR
jgi:thymidine phosphorylase